METIIRNQRIELYTPNEYLASYATWKQEPENLDFIDSLVPGKDVFLDLGACEGRFTIYAAKKGITTISLEPEERNFNILLANISLNQLKNVIPLKQAIGSYSHTSQMIVGSVDIGGHHRVVQDALGRIDLKEAVVCQELQDIQVVSLDDLAKEYQFNAIKIDIDGSENEFMIGGENILSGKNISNLMFEMFSTDSTYPKIMNQLADWDFRIYQNFLIESCLYNTWFKKDANK